MIEREGYKAFHGTMRITPNSTDKQPVDITTDWLYKPMYDCWYGDGCSFDADICAVVEDQSVEKTADQMFKELGYKRDYPNEPQGVILYSDKIQDCKIYLVDFHVAKNIKECGTWEAMDLRFDEILACAKLIEEMGW